MNFLLIYVFLSIYLDYLKIVAPFKKIYFLKWLQGKFRRVACTLRREKYVFTSVHKLTNLSEKSHVPANFSEKMRETSDPVD